MKRLRWTAVLVAAAGLLAGCGEVSNTLTPQAGTANTLTVALDGAASFNHVGIFEAEAQGRFTETDLKVHVITSSDPLAALESGRAQVAISNEPAILLARNTHVALAAVAAILQTPQQVTVSCRAPKTSTKRRAPRAHPPLRPARCLAKTVARPRPSYANAPTYNGLNFVVTEHEIVYHAPILRRFIQAVARGYTTARANPASATANLVKLNPGLNYTEQLVGVKASMSNFFPSVVPGETTAREWGWQRVDDWNAFGSWLYDRHTITDPNAIPDADTNELLAGQGV